MTNQQYEEAVNAIHNLVSQSSNNLDVQNVWDVVTELWSEHENDVMEKLNVK